MLTPQQLLTTARICLGTPWRHQGRLPGVALDCVGLILMPLRAHGLLALLGLQHDFDITGYNPMAHDVRMEILLDGALARVSPTQLCPADIVTMGMPDGLPQHLGWVGGVAPHLTLLHSYNGNHPKHRCVIEHRLAGSFRTGVRQAYRLPEVVWGA